MLTNQQIEVAINERGAIAMIGQVTAAQRRILEKCVRAGSLVKFRGFWNTHSRSFGIGPLKTIYALPSYAEADAERHAYLCRKSAA